MSDSQLPVGDFVLDSRIQLWVLLPISLATLAMALMRRTLSLLAVDEIPPTILKTSDAQLLGRSANLRISPGIISHDQFASRQHYLSHERTGALLSPRYEARGATSALMSPQTLANQVTGLMSSIVPQMILGAWASWLFAGVAVCRLPFPLSPRYRGMLQSGMEAAGQNVAVHYVSALSWYLLNLFGNAGIVHVFTYGTEEVATPNIAVQVQMSMNAGKVFETERTEVSEARHTSLLDEIELAVLKT